MMIEPPDAETEFGVPFPGRIVPKTEWTKTGLKQLPTKGPLDWKELFGRKAPIVVDLGCGNGRYSLLSALARPEFDHIGIDVLPIVIRYAVQRANRRGLKNARFAVVDAQSFVRDRLAASSVTEIHLYHPQPYHDPGKAALRLVTPRFLAQVHQALVDGGRFVIQTDNPDYWDYILKILPIFFDFQERHEPWADAPEGRSRREILSRSRGVRIFRGEGTRRDGLTRSEAVELADGLPQPTFRSNGPWLELDGIDP